MNQNNNNQNNQQNNNQKPFNNNQNNNQNNQQKHQQHQNQQKQAQMVGGAEKAKSVFNKHKVTIILILAVALVVLGAVFSNKKVAKAPVEETKTEEVVDVKSPIPANITALSYTDALKAYDGKTITIGDSCVSVPSERTFAVGTRVLLNNIGKDPILVSLDQKTSTINSYHYATASLKNKGVFKLTCNSKEVVTVTVE